MFEVGMSALVLKICSEYAKSLGLNFPPCTQQEINAICEWVDKHTIKDMTISQDGYNVTFTFKTENDVTKEFTFAIPKAVDIDELEKVLKGSDSVVVDRLADNSGLQVRLAQSILNDINSKLAKPATPTADSAVTMLADGTVGTKPLSEIGGGKLYKHYINISFPDGGNVYLISFTLYSNYSSSYTYLTLPRDNEDLPALSTGQHIGSVGIKISGQDQYPTIYIKGVVSNLANGNTVELLNISFSGENGAIDDTVTAL